MDRTILCIFRRPIKNKSVLIDIKGFFRHYKDKYNKKTKVFKWLPCSKALLEIRKSMNNYRKLKNVL